MAKTAKRTTATKNETRTSKNARSTKSTGGATRTQRAKPLTTAKAVKRVKKAATETANAAEGMLSKAAAGTGRTLGRAVRGVERAASTLKKNSASAVRRVRRAPSKPKKDPQVELERAKTRAVWKSQAADAMKTELAKHGSMVDERARVRSTMGMSWSNRKPR
jgi:hypothetical protein